MREYSKNTEQQLQEADNTPNKIYQILIEKMPEGVATLNKEGIILYCNPSFASMVNLPSQDVVGTKFEKYINSSSKEFFETLFTESWNEALQDEIHLHDNVDMVMPVLLSASAFELDNTIVLGIILTDNTIRNKSQEELTRRTRQLENNLLRLKGREKRFRLLVKNIKDYSIIMLDLNGNINSWNPGAEHIYGYSSNEIMNKHISVFYTEEEILRKEPERNLLIAKEEGRYETEALRIRKDGSFFFADVIFTTLYDDSLNFQGFATITRDITERKRTEEKLKESDNQIRTIFKSAPDAVTVINEDGIITKWNPKAEALFGWTSEEVMGKYLHEVIIPERHREAHQRGMKHFLETGRGPLLNKPVEMPALRKNSSEFQVELSISHFQFRKKYFFIGFIKDITERKIAQEKIKESEERFLKIFDNNPVAMTLSEIKTNKIISANKLFYSTFGYNQEEIIGQTSDDLHLMSDEERERLASHIVDYLKENRTITELRSLTSEEKEKLLEQLRSMKGFEIQFTRKNGELFYAFVTYEIVEIGNEKYTITSYLDITERKINEAKIKQKSEELAQTNKELIFQYEEKEKRTAELRAANSDVKALEELVVHKDSILAIVSHDLRSPLSGIIGTAEFLKSNFEEMDPNDVKEMLTLLCESSKEELNMLDYLVEWARIKYASDTFTPTKIALASCVTKVFDTLNDTAAVNSIGLHHEIKEDIIVFADKKMLLSILQNIISNAIKHSLPGGIVTVNAQRKNDTILVEIKDTGIGMSEETQEKIFTPQLDSLSLERKDNKGAGIGLLLAKGFLEKNSGKIWVESAEGKGSSFYFTLPANEPQNK